MKIMVSWMFKLKNELLEEHYSYVQMLLFAICFLIGWKIGPIVIAYFGG